MMMPEHNEEGLVMKMDSNILRKVTEMLDADPDSVNFLKEANRVASTRQMNSEQLAAFQEIVLLTAIKRNPKVFNFFADAVYNTVNA
jgi:hypothetical protein